MNKVFLVGAGPGDPDLLTVKASRLLATAEVVLHDDLVAPEILALANSTARIINVGKRCGNKLLSQQEINSLLIEYANSCGTVVRLKGGDPSIFGRCGEEIEALEGASVEFEIVPGITAALAAAASAKVTLTDRRFASSLVLVTAHRGHGADGVEWSQLVASSSTLAVYMPGSDYGSLTENLIGAGLDSTTPCLVVSRIATQEQQILRVTLAGLVSRTPLPAPSLLIVGRCANPQQQAEAAWQILQSETDQANSFNAA